MFEGSEGDEYDARVENLPRLFVLAANTSTADRARIIDLITDLGAPVEDDEDDEYDEDELASYQEANALVRARAEQFVSLLADDEAAVRKSAAFAVAAFLGDADRLITLFQQRMDVETEVECRIALLQAAARSAADEPSVAQRLTPWLERIVGEDGDPATRLTALAQLARSVRDRPSDGVLNQAIALLREVADESVGGLLRDLNDALGDRVDDRVALIEDQLSYPDPRRRVEALRLAGYLMSGWRGSYEGLVALIGAQLSSPEPQVARMALLALKDKYDLVVPAADALAEQVASAGPDAWNRADREARDGYRDMLLMLAIIGDERALPLIKEKLPEGAHTLGHALAKYRDHADRFVPTLRDQLDACADELAPGRHYPLGVFGLLLAVRDLGAIEVLPQIRRLVDAAMRGEHWLVVKVALRVLASIGPAAVEAYDVAAGLTASEANSGEIALRAIEACWSLRGDADALLPLLETRLREAAGTHVEDTAAKVAAAIGPRAAPLADHLRTLMAAATNLWTRVNHAIALTRVAGPQAFPSVHAVLHAAWQENPHTRVRIAECVRDLGTAAESFHPTLRAELASPRRHNVTTLVVDSISVPEDERLLKLCAQALEP